MTETSFYIAKALSREMKAFDGSVMVPAGRELWLGQERDGYYSLTTMKSDAKKFRSSEEAIEKAAQWDGMPWYHRMEPGSLKVIKVTERREYVRTEEEIEA